MERACVTQPTLALGIGLRYLPSFTASSGGDAAFLLDNGIPAYTSPPIISGTYGTFNTTLLHGLVS